MMGQKHLRDLLKEDQQPFQLHDYIAHRRSYFNSCSSSSSSSLQNKKISKHIINKSSSSKLSFCKKACFLSFRDSPDLKKSPFPSPDKTPVSSANIFLHIPAKTAAMLLEAAIKIHKKSSKHKTKSTSFGFGLFGSFFKRIKNQTKNYSTTSFQNYLLVFGNGKSKEVSEKNDKIYVNYDNSRVSSAGWSESNEGTTSRSDFTEEIDFASFDKQFCLTPSSPFRFALDSSSGSHQTPEILSPVTSPICHKQEDNHLEESLGKVQVEEEEEKEQCSPVSVLDPQFEDDEPNSGDEMDEDDDDFEVECSYANVQRVKLQLLHKLRRFEKLAELDPVELEKRMSEDDDEYIVEEEECNYVVDESRLLYMEENLDEVVREVLSRSNQCQLDKIPLDVRRLLLDLIAEEQKIGTSCSLEAMVCRVCKRLNAWKEVESNTIDMMVELDFKKELDQWKRYQEEVGDRAKEIEVAIFEFLVEELVS